MKSYALAGLLLMGFAAPALAAQQYFAVKDTVGYCSVIDVHPSSTKVSGLTILGNKGGYDSEAAAQKTLSSASGCKAIIERT